MIGPHGVPPQLHYTADEVRAKQRRTLDYAEWSRRLDGDAVEATGRARRFVRQLLASMRRRRPEA